LELLRKAILIIPEDPRTRNSEDNLNLRECSVDCTKKFKLNVGRLCAERLELKTVELPVGETI